MILIGNSAFSNRDVFLPVPAGYTERTDGTIEATDLIFDTTRSDAVRQGGAGGSFRAVLEGEVGEAVTRERIVLCLGEHTPEERQPGEPIPEAVADPEPESPDEGETQEAGEKTAEPS